MTSDARLKSTVTSIFLRKGKSGQSTLLWDESKKGQRDASSAGIAFLQGELGVLISGSNAQTRLLLTTRRLVYRSVEVPIERIVKVEPIDFTTETKANLTGFNLTTHDGATVAIRVEPGPPYFGLWSVLLHLAKKNLRRFQTTAT